MHSGTDSGPVAGSWVTCRAHGTQRIDHLAQGIAYEHWHRMLFARFLAESDLLIEPDSGVAITTDECAELARETGEDPHALAARFAQSALPPDLPYRGSSARLGTATRDSTSARKAH